MHDISFTLSYALFDVLFFNGEIHDDIITFTDTEASDRKWQKSSNQFKCRSMLTSTYIFHEIDVIIAL